MTRIQRDDGDSAEAELKAMKSLVRAFWEEEACGERYGDDQEALRYRLEPEICEFAEFSSARDLEVLEIGAGMGADLVRFARAGASITGVDLTYRATELAAKRIEREGLRVGVGVADAEALPFRNGSFDLVYSWGVIHHTPGPDAAIREAIRVLRPGGRLKLMLYQRHSWVAIAAWVRFGVLMGRPWRTLRRVVSHIESPGTQAFSRREGLQLINELDRARARAVVTTWDRRVAGPLATLAGNRFGWFLLLEGERPGSC